MNDVARDTAARSGPGDIMISIRNLEKVYKTGNSSVNALRGIDLDVPRGSIFGIIDIRIEVDADTLHKPARPADKGLDHHRWRGHDETQTRRTAQNAPPAGHDIPAV